MSTLIVDADIVAYKLSTVSEKPIRWENDVWTLHSDETECIVMIKDYFDNLKEQTECTKIVCAFSDKNNFRTSILPDYKLNRINTRKPLTLKFCKDYIYKNYNGYSKPNLEADGVEVILLPTLADRLTTVITPDESVTMAALPAVKDPTPVLPPVNTTLSVLLYPVPPAITPTEERYS